QLNRITISAVFTCVFIIYSYVKIYPGLEILSFQAATSGSGGSPSMQNRKSGYATFLVTNRLVLQRDIAISPVVCMSEFY
ncbi:MAG: hypothetical protein ACNYWU_13115, partial [Desulfobacterales bacterium]